MFLIGGAGAWVVKSDGLLFRFPKSVRELFSNQDLQFYENIRIKKCFLDDPVQTAHDSSCYESQHPQVLLWGDSIAASLYPGLRKLQSKRAFGVTQLTQASCSPMAKRGGSSLGKRCDLIQERIIKELELIRPDVIVLSSIWMNEDSPVTQEQLQKNVEELLKQIQRQAPQAIIILIGPFPDWGEPLQTILFRSWLGRARRDQLPSLSLPAHRDELTGVTLKKVAGETGAIYLDPFRDLCEGGNCRTRTGARALDLMYVDSFHLSVSGATFFVDQIQEVLLSR